MKNFRFTKMHGIGNDFIVIDAITQAIRLNPSDIITLAHRNTGIGFDQCLIVESSKEAEVDFFYRIFNANGEEVGQCGNGARCIARFVNYYGLTHKTLITVATLSTKMQLKINPDNSVTVTMGKPTFQPHTIPLNPTFFSQVSGRKGEYELKLANGETHSFYAVNVGNPHAISVVESVEQIPIHQLGKEISQHPSFPHQSNAGFMQLLKKNHIRLRVYERGCGETQACGSAAVAAAAIARLYFNLDEKIHVALPGGELIVEWPDLTQSIYLTGTATFVYEGKTMIISDKDTHKKEHS